MFSEFKVQLLVLDVSLIRIMRKLAFCKYKSKGNCAADQGLCFPYIDSTPQPLYCTDRYNTVFDITRVIAGPQMVI